MLAMQSLYSLAKEIASNIVEKQVHNVCNEAKTNLKECIEQRLKTIDVVEELAADLDKHHINVARAKVVGSLGKLAGGGIATFGGTALATFVATAAAPVTGGLSLLIPAAMITGGAGLAVIGGVTCTG